MKTQANAESSSSNPSGYLLSLQPQPPRYAHTNVWFPVRVFMIDAANVLKTGWNVRLTATLHYFDDGEVCPPDVQKVMEFAYDTPLVIAGDGSASLRMRLVQASMLHSNRAFFVEFAVDAAAKTKYGDIESCRSTHFHVVRHRLRVVEQPPPHWYKDEGGRDKSISLSAMLIDEDDNIVKGREVPIHLQLLYENADADKAVLVKAQSILKSMIDVQPRIDPATGRCIIKIRIEEVSKNHQKQAFCIRFAPDTAYDPAAHDVAPAMSTPITILSKRNKRKKKDGTWSHSDDVELNGGAADGVSTLNSPPQGSAASPQSGLAALMQAANGTDAPANGANGTPLSKHEKAVNALNGIINWCRVSMKTMLSLEWQHVGFEVTEDGGLNLHRPMYRCPGCWTYRDTIRPAAHQQTCGIAKATQQYQHYVITHLNDLVAFINAPESTLTATANNPNLSMDAPQRLESQFPVPMLPTLPELSKQASGSGLLSLHLMGHASTGGGGLLSASGNKRKHSRGAEDAESSGSEDETSDSRTMRRKTRLTPTGVQNELTALERNVSMGIPYLQSFNSIPMNYGIPSMQPTLSFHDLNLPIHQKQLSQAVSLSRGDSGVPTSIQSASTGARV